MVFRNTQVFTTDGYDMVVAVTQKAINDQLRHLTHPDVGVLKTSLIVQIEPTPDGQDYKVTFFNKWDDVVKGADGKPILPTLQGQYTPSISITDTDRYVNLDLKFMSGNLHLKDALSGTSITTSIKDWSFTMDIRLDMQSLGKSEIAKGAAMPAQVLHNLTEFTSADFAVSRLFLNFNASELLGGHTTTSGPSGDRWKDAFSIFISHYLKALAKDPLHNPYNLGYTVVNTDKTADPDKDVPDMFKPHSATFTMFKDSKNSQRSLLNWAISTLDHKDRQLSDPHKFEQSWLTDAPDCHGKMIYSSMFLSRCILEPFYRKYAEATHDKVAAQFNNHPWLQADKLGANAFETARSPLSNGASFRVCQFANNNVRYMNHYEVKWTSSGSQIKLEFNGCLRLDFHRSHDMAICTAVADAWTEKQWSAILTIDSAPDAKGKMNLTASDPVVRDNGPTPNSGHQTNDCAKGWGTIASIFGSVLDVITGFQNNFAAIFKDFFEPDETGYIPPKLVLGSLMPQTNRKFMLPAGNVFSFKNPEIIEDECFSTQIEYKTEDAVNALTASALVHHDNYHVVTNVISKALIPKLWVDTTHKMASNLFVYNHPKDRLHRHTTAYIKSMAGTAETISPQTPTSTSSPMQDVVRLMTTGPNSRVYNVAVSCELMKNAHKAMPVSPQKKFQVVQDQHGRPIIFSITETEGFQMLASADGDTSSGWKTVDILSQFGANCKTESFDIYQDLQSRVSLAFTVQAKEKPLAIFFLDRIPVGDVITACGSAKARAKLIAGADPNMICPNIRMAPSDDNQSPVLTVEGKVNADHVFYQNTGGDLSLNLFNLPFNVDRASDKLISHCKGFLFGQRANIFLYSTADVLTCAAITTADASNGSLNYDFGAGTLPEKYRSLQYNAIETAVSRQAVEDGGAASDIYLCCRSGLYRIPNGVKKRTEVVSEEIADVHGLTVSLYGNDISLWAMCSPNVLWYIAGKREVDDDQRHVIRWRRPISFASSVLGVAPIISGSKRRHNELFVLTQEQSIDHYWQATRGGSWLSRKATLPRGATVLQQDSYTVHVHVENDRFPISGMKLRLATSQWQYCTVNGKMYSLDQDVFADVSTDSLGNLTIIAPAVDICPPVLHLRGGSETFHEQLDIHPEGKIKHHLSAIKNGKDLLDARDGDGHVILANTSQGTADAIASTFVKLQSSSDAHYPPALQGRVFVAIQEIKDTSPLTPLVVRIAAPKLTNHNGCFGFRSVSGSWQMLRGEAATTHLITAAAFSNLWEDVSHWAGDFWHMLGRFADSAYKAVLDAAIELENGVSILFNTVAQGLEMLVTIGRQAFRLILDTIKDVLKAISYVLKIVGIDLGKMMKWLGHVLGWDHVWGTHQVYARLLTNAIHFAEAEADRYIDIARASSRAAFDGFNDKIRTLLLPESIKGSKGGEQRKKGQQKRGTNSAQVNFVQYHLMHSTTEPSSSQVISATTVSCLSATTATTDDPLQQFLTDVLEPVFEKIKAKLGDDVDALVKLLDDFTIENMLALIVEIMATATETAVSVVDGLLVFLKDLIKDIIHVLEQAIDVPFFTDLWDFLLDLFDLQEPFTVINACSLLLAMMTCTFSQMLGVDTVDTSDTTAILDIDFFRKLKDGQHSTNFIAMIDGPHPVKEHITTPLENYNLCASLLTGAGGVLICAADALRVGGRPTPFESFNRLILGIAVTKLIFAFPLPESKSTYGWRAFTWAMSSGWRVVAEGLQIAPDGRAMTGTGAEAGKARAVGFCVVDFFSMGCSIVVDVVEQQPPFTIVIDVFSNLSGLAASIGSGVEQPEIEYTGLAAAGLFAVLGVFAAVDTHQGGQIARYFNMGGS